jgi:hypothetical protein
MNLLFDEIALRVYVGNYVEKVNCLVYEREPEPDDRPALGYNLRLPMCRRSTLWRRNCCKCYLQLSSLCSK